MAQTIGNIDSQEAMLFHVPLLADLVWAFHEGLSSNDVLAVAVELEQVRWSPGEPMLIKD